MQKHIDRLVQSLKSDTDFTHFLFRNSAIEGPLLYPKTDVFYSEECTVVVLHGDLQSNGQTFLSTKAFYPETDRGTFHWDALYHYLHLEAGLGTASCSGAKALRKLLY